MVIRKHRALPEDSICCTVSISEVAEMLRELKQFLENNNSPILLPGLISHDTNSITVEYIYGIHPNKLEIRKLLPGLCKAFESLKQASGLNWTNTTLDIICLFSQSFPIRTDNFIETIDGKIYLVDPFLHSFEADAISCILNQLIEIHKAIS